MTTDTNIYESRDDVMTKVCTMYSQDLIIKMADDNDIFATNLKDYCRWPCGETSPMISIVFGARLDAARAQYGT